MDSSPAATPLPEDGYGYRVTQSDLEFLGLTTEDVDRLTHRQCPLGMTLRKFDRFVTSLQDTLAREGIRSCDVRLQGSSAHFFSGHHKTMPRSRSEIYHEFKEAHNRLPHRDVLDSIEATIRSVWPTRRQPTRRPFDSMYRLEINPDPSDYDIQISSDDIVNRVRAALRDLAIPILDDLMTSRRYGFLDKVVIAQEFPFLKQWQTLQRRDLNRLVTIAAFSAAGPDNLEDKIGLLSSHFRLTDWILFQWPA